MFFEGTSSDVSAILFSVIDGNRTITLEDPGEQIEGVSAIIVEKMGIATVKHLEKDQFEVHALHCFAPSHGAHPKFANITKQLEKHNIRQNKNITCPMCSGGGWLPADGDDAKTAAGLAVSFGFFRGVELPKTEELARAQEKAGESAFSGVLNHPLVTRIRSELENREPGADAKK
ncbi:MAG: hypothetical protein GY841_15695 [FCB group bacterium]|nr:hypothetical protein [FCB group bacterium]